MTYGEIIKTVFPNVKEYAMGDNNLVAVFIGTLRINVSKDVWNKKYEEPKEIHLIPIGEERQKWKQAIKDIKAELAKTFWCDDDAYIKTNDIIDKHTKELTK